jgi:hypothetical protein
MEKTMKIYKLAAIAVAPLFLAGCPGPEDDPMLDDDRTTEERVHQVGDTETLGLGEVDDSNVTGDVRFTVLSEQETDVVVEVNDAMPNATYQAAIHRGTCDAPGQQVHALETIQTNAEGDGAGSTTLNIRLAQVMDGNHVVALHGPAAPDARTDVRTDTRTDAPADARTDIDTDVETDLRTDVRTDRPVSCGEIGEAGNVLGW